MAKDRFKKYLWIVNKLYTTGGISYKDLVKAWECSVLNDEGTPLPKRTFDDYRNAIEETFDINILCDASDGYKYKLCDAEGLQKDTVKSWLLSSFAVNNSILESRKLKRRILFEQIPSVQERDYNDSHRAVAPLKQAEDAVLLDTTGITLEESVSRLIQCIKERSQ